MQQAFVGTSFCDFHRACLFLCVHNCGSWDFLCVLAGSSRLAFSELKDGLLKCSATRWWTFLNCFYSFTQRFMEFKEEAERKISGLEEAMAAQENQVW